MKKPIPWSIAGIDPTGLAGTYIDLEIFKQFQVDGCAVVTAVTAQNTMGISAIEFLSAEHIAAQYDALVEEFKPCAIKMGMLGSIAAHEQILKLLKEYQGFTVLDPVLRSSTGHSLVGEDADMQQYINSLIRLFPYIDVLTPNRDEAGLLLNRTLTTYEDIIDAAHALLALGANSVVIKGGHVADDRFSQDYWTNGQESLWLANTRMPAQHYRGTGCTFSAAIAACCALGYSIKDALVIAKMYVHRGIRNAVEVTKGTARLAHKAWPEEDIDLPYCSSQPMTCPPTPFKTYATGLYPVVDNSDWIERLAPLGVKTVQLRIKNLQGEPLKRELQRGVLLAKQYQVTLFINDYWELAIALGAAGVHLGQEDLLTADVEAIRRAGLYLGISTHCYYEVATAHRFSPSYMACGPIYYTSSKIMPFQPQGIEQLKRWRRTLHYPLVAIGGMTLARLPEVLSTKVEGVALISAITKAANPALATKQLLGLITDQALLAQLDYPPI